MIEVIEYERRERLTLLTVIFCILCTYIVFDFLSTNSNIDDMDGVKTHGSIRSLSDIVSHNSTFDNFSYII